MGDSAEVELEVTEIVADGDILLDVTFETSKKILNAARKATKPRPGQQAVAPPVFKPRTRLGYRVRMSTLIQLSKYFDFLLRDTRYVEAKSVTAAFDRLSLQQIKPSEAAAKDLPVVKIIQDDEATESADKDKVFGDMLRILHQKEPTTKPVTMKYLATLAVLADRFDCAAPLSQSLTTSLKIKWPATQPRQSREDFGLSLTKPAEEALRQKILASWILNQPLKMAAATRELIIYGSRKWNPALEEDGDSAMWWDLPSLLEKELQHRRECILETIASVQRYFVHRYSSRDRQCRLGYDSSASCDSYQLGEMIKFLVGRNLMSLTDFSPFSFNDTPQHWATVDINDIISTLKKCPSYQIDKNHTNCGLRTHIHPILDYISAMLSANVIAVSRDAWVRSKDAIRWLPDESKDCEKENTIFRFTRSVRTDQRLRYEGVMAADKMAKALFTADEWDWSPED